MSEPRALLAYPRLCIAYFCQFAIWGAWAGGALSGYANHIGLSGPEVGMLFNAIPFGAIIAPLFIGPIADRYFSAQKVLSLLHFIGGLALIACGVVCLTGQHTFPILMTLMLISGICFMPTMGLIHAVVFKHLPSPSLGPYVFVFGTIGWITVNLIIAVFCGGEKTPKFFLVGGGVAVFLSLYALTLPNTPPQGASATETGKDSGAGVLTLFKQFSFLIFVVCAFCASIPACNYYFPVMGLYLSEIGCPSPVAIATINQFSEIILMTALPFFIYYVGLKYVLLIGMAAWAIRYALFAQMTFEFALGGLLLHGFCYSFLYMASYMYAEKVAPEGLKSSAQSMMVFLLLGVGQVLGGWSVGHMSDYFKSSHTGVVMPLAQVQGFQPEQDGLTISGDIKAAYPEWSAGEGSVLQYLDLAQQVKKALKHEEEKGGRKIDLGKLLGNDPLTATAIDKWTEEQLTQEKAGFGYHNVNVTGSGVVPIFKDGKAVQYPAAKPEGTVVYDNASFKKAFTEMAGGKSELTRNDWFKAQARQWDMIFYIPSAFIAVFFVIFLLLGKDPDAKKKEA